MIKLNKAQQDAVTAPDGPALVMAGAGSGKTRVIIERLAWLVDERGVDPRHLLALTFTNRAAREMRERLAARLKMAETGVWLGTFHSFGLFFLRREMRHLGRRQGFTVFDDADQLSLVKRLIRDLPTRYAPVRPRDALGWISDYKQRVEVPDPDTPATHPEEESYRVLWGGYHGALEAASAVDFDDLLVLTVRLLEDHEDVRARYQRRYQHLLVDEYQDTNRAQYLIARHLSGGHGNLFVVGDEDQSIYSWRGADINNILDFSEDFPEAKVYKLEQNYRCTKPILDGANKVVANNTQRLGKTLWTDNTEGEPVRFVLAENAEDEARSVITDLGARQISPGDAAVLYRTNAQARAMEEACLKKGISYVVTGGVKFYARKEIKDLLCYLRLLVNPDDDESLRRILNVPARGIGPKTMAIFEDYAKMRSCSIFAVLRDIESDGTVPTPARNAATVFVQMIDDLAIEAKSGPIRPVAERLLEETGYEDFVEKSDEKDFRTRLENIEEFLDGCDRYDREESKPLAEYLQDLSLMTDADSYDPGGSALTLMTCHNAKGLEFDYVYLIGLEEGLFPHVRGEDTAFEEERRLCYVAMTRAKKGLTLSAARERTLYGRTEVRDISCFVAEAGIDTSPPPVKRQKSAPRPGAAGEAAEAVRTGTRVRHAKFGMGTVMFTKGSGQALKARIRFDSGRSALLMMRVAPVEIVEGKQR